MIMNEQETQVMHYEWNGLTMKKHPSFPYPQFPSHVLLFRESSPLQASKQQ